MKRTIDVRKGKKAIRVSIVQFLRNRLVSDDTRNKRRATFDDVVLRFPPLQGIFGDREDKRGVSFSKDWGHDVLF